MGILLISFWLQPQCIIAKVMPNCKFFAKVPEMLAGAGSADSGKKKAGPVGKITGNNYRGWGKVAAC